MLGKTEIANKKWKSSACAADKCSRACWSIIISAFKNIY